MSIRWLNSVTVAVFFAAAFLVSIVVAVVMMVRGN